MKKVIIAIIAIIVAVFLINVMGIVLAIVFRILMIGALAFGLYWGIRYWLKK